MHYSDVSYIACVVLYCVIFDMEPADVSCAKVPDIRSTGVLWREIGAAFDNRVLTGAVLNSNYIEPRNFLQDAATIVPGVCAGCFEETTKPQSEHGVSTANL